MDWLDSYNASASQHDQPARMCQLYAIQHEQLRSVSGRHDAALWGVFFSGSAELRAVVLHLLLLLVLLRNLPSVFGDFHLQDQGV